MNLRDLIRNWLGLTDLRNEMYAVGHDIHKINSTCKIMLDELRASDIRKIREVADVAQGLSELDPRRRALSDATNDYLTRKAHAEAKVRQHFGYGPDGRIESCDPDQLPPASDE